MRIAMTPFALVSFATLAAATAACDSGPRNAPPNHATAMHSASIVDSVPGKCTAGRRFGFMFWGHAQGEQAQRVLNAHFHDNVPGAVVWGTDASSMTVVVPDEASGELVIQQARGLHLKIARVDWVGISAECQLTWMNHGESPPRPSSDVADAGDETPPGDAGLPPVPTIDPATQAKADACQAALDKDMLPYAKVVNQQTSVASTRMLLRIFSKSCAVPFPDLAKAADHASKVGRAARSKTLAAAASAACPGAAKATVATDVLTECPPAEGSPTLPVWALLDAGTYAFTQLLKHDGLHGTFTEELILQASLHPELDK